MPKEKETQDQYISTQGVFGQGDAPVHCRAPLGETPSQCRIVFNPENGNRDDHIGASLHQSSQRFFGIRFRKDDQRHDRMNKGDFDPPLERTKRNIRPGDGNETVEKKSDEPTVLQNNF
jgi:hypothetical protein